MSRLLKESKEKVSFSRRMDRPAFAPIDAPLPKKEAPDCWQSTATDPSVEIILRSWDW
jgi:hypothetical protein